MYHSFSTGGVANAPNSVEFYSTSAYSSSTTSSISYSTAPMHMANGTVKTVASSIQGGVLSEEPTGYTDPNRIRGRQNTMAPPTETAPLGDGWDVAILLAILCLSYGIYLRRNATTKEAK